MRKLLSPAFFVLAAAAFFLPFVTVSCNVGPLGGALPEVTPEGEEVPQLPADGRITIIEATGFELITDDIEPAEDLRQFEDLGEVGETPAEAEAPSAHGRIWVILAAVAAVGGIVLSLLAGRLGAALTIAMGVLGAAFLGIFTMAFRSGLDSELAEGAEAPGVQASQFLEISYQYGFWLALALLLAAAAVGAWGLMSERPAAPAGAPPAAPGAPPPAEPAGPPPAEPAGPPPAEPGPPPSEPGAPPPEPGAPPERPGGPPPREEGGPPPAYG